MEGLEDVCMGNLYGGIHTSYTLDPVMEMVRLMMENNIEPPDLESFEYNRYYSNFSIFDGWGRRLPREFYIDQYRELEKNTQDFFGYYIDENDAEQIMQVYLKIRNSNGPVNSEILLEILQGQGLSREDAQDVIDLTTEAFHRRHAEKYDFAGYKSRWVPLPDFKGNKIFEAAMKYAEDSLSR